MASSRWFLGSLAELFRTPLIPRWTCLEASTAQEQTPGIAQSLGVLGFRRGIVRMLDPVGKDVGKAGA